MYILSLLSLAAFCYAQIDLLSCNSTDLICIQNKTLADQERLELPGWVTYPITSDPFYTTPANFSANATNPGSVLKLELRTNTTAYDVPPGQALSRIFYTSTDAYGNVVPATAILLWPFTPKPFHNSTKYPLVAWAHGTSGIARQCAVSDSRNLQYDFRSVFTMASLGYAVVIPDYVGLGSEGDFNYLAYKLHADDLVYAVQAAQSVFTQLSCDWLSIGHSEGGGVAWAVAERQATDPIPGFLGTIAAAPPPFQIDTTSDVGTSVFTAFLSFTISRLYGLDLTEVFKPVALQALQYVLDIGGCNDAGYAAWAGFTADELYANVSWPMSSAAEQFLDDYSVSGRALGGPMLIVQGDSDTVVGTDGSVAGFDATCDAQGKNVSIEYLWVEGQDHNPSLYASQRVWLQWIEDRFEGKPVEAGCKTSNLSSAFENVQLPERFTVGYTKPWITIFSSTFLPEDLQAEDLGFPENITAAA